MSKDEVVAVQTAVLRPGDPLPVGTIRRAWKLNEEDYGRDAVYLVYVPTKRV